jgi:hypothetical protein
MNNEENITLEELERDRERYEEDLKRYQKMNNLLKNKDFQEIFIKDFIENGSVNVVRMLNSEFVKDKFIIKQYKKQMTGIGILKNFIDMTMARGREAQRMLNEIDQYIEEMNK